MKVLVTGYNGQLGYDVVREFKSRNIEAKGVDLDDFSITDRDAVFAYTDNYKPDVIVHCAAYTAVDKAEENEDICRAVNVSGAENMALAAERVGAKIIYFSTDYVFKGTGNTAFETDDPKGPLSVYGLTKYEGEQATEKSCPRHFIIRISWVFGINGNNFIKTMLRLSETHDTLTVVNDQIGSPTYTVDLAKLVCDMALTEKYGYYHATNEGYCSWSEFATAIFKKAGKSVKVVPLTSEEYGAPANRPKNSRLSKKSLDENGFSRLPTWESALERYLSELEGTK